MKRGIITNNGQGIHISDGEVWMTSWEIADLFNTPAGLIYSAISIYNQLLLNNLQVISQKYGRNL